MMTPQVLAIATVTFGVLFPTALLLGLGAVGDRDLAGDWAERRVGGLLPPPRRLPGAPMPAKVIERALRMWPETGFVNAYGLTETSSTIAVLGPDDHRAALDSDDEAVRASRRQRGQLHSPAAISAGARRATPSAASLSTSKKIRSARCSSAISRRSRKATR